MYEPFDDTAVRVLLAVNPGDSIRTVAQHLHTPYETVRQAVNQLEDAGYLRYDDGLFVTDDRVRKAARDLLATSAAVNPPSIEEAYVLPQFAGREFAYTSIDAVYIWTRGGYQIAHDPEDYPLFITVAETDLEDWIQFFERFDIPVAQERQPADEISQAIQFVLKPCAAVEAETVDGRPVIPLQETVEFARDHYATFQSALDMLGRMYEEVETDADYRMEPA